MSTHETNTRAWLLQQAEIEQSIIDALVSEIKIKEAALERHRRRYYELMQAKDDSDFIGVNPHGEG